MEKIVLIYSMSGETLAVDSTDYCFSGSLILRNGRLSRYLFDGGYCSFTLLPSIGNTQYATTFHYYQQDHLGNIREVINGNNGTVEQQTHYYPFGGIIADISTNQNLQPNKYNGKELDLMHGLNTYDYGARQYDPITVTWNGMDPLAEKYRQFNPLAYCMDNPVKHVDKDGRKIVLAKGVSTSFKQDYEHTVQTLKDKGCGDVWQALNDSPEIYTLAESFDNSNYFVPSTRTVFWNSRKGLYTTNDAYLSPATRLNHELSHALQYNNNPEQFKKDNKARVEEEDETYTLEEKRAIEGVESQTAACLGEIHVGEVTRHDHSGIPFDTNSPISNIELNPFNIIVFPK